MEQLLYDRVKNAPDALAIIDGERTFTYKELIVRSEHLVESLYEKHLSSEEPICIVFGTGYAQIIAQVAVLRAGGSCVPVDPSVPQERLDSMLRNINARLIMTSVDLAERFSAYDVVPILDHVETRFSEGDQSLQALSNCSEDHRSHILFTSGSTGRPKPVQITARSILHLVKSTPLTPLKPSDRVAELNNPGFDLSLFEIWISLLSGSTIVVVPKTIASDPFGFADFIKERKVTVMILPTALFTIMATTCPYVFQGTRHVLSCGEAPNVKVMRDVVTKGGPEYLWNGYGPTECTTFVSLQHVDENETARETVSIGKAVGQSKIFLLDDEMRPILDSQREGEIYLGGPGLSKGYLNEPDANERNFVEIDASRLNENSAWPIRLFKTGDLAKWRVPSEILDYRGRFDMQVKQDGFRVELGDVEVTLEGIDGIKQSVVLQELSFTNKILVAYVLPSARDSDLNSNAVKDHVRDKLPFYMVPSRIVIVSGFPLTAHGKIDREALARENQQILKDSDRTTCYTDRSTKQADDDLIINLKQLVQQLLSVPNLLENDDFFSLGMTSLEAARFIGLVMNRFNKRVSMDMLLENPTVAKLAAILVENKETNPSLVDTDLMEADTQLADSIPVVPDWQSDGEGRVFVTGVTGFVGVHFLSRLLSLPTVKKVACLARGRKGLSASSRIQNTMERYNIWETSSKNMGKIIILDGDMVDKTLGLGEEKFTWLTNWASVVFHLGAKVNYCEPYQRHFAANVIGTKNVIRVAALGRRKSLHYMSSIDAWGPTGLILGTKTLREDESLQPHLKSLPYDTGYAHSQWVAEELVHRMRDRGLPTAIYRPGFTIGDATTAISNPDDFFARLVVGCIKIGYWPCLPDQRMEYVTVDYVCSALIHIASSNHNLGRAYSLVAPDHSQSVDLRETGTMINQTGHSVKEIPYNQWVKKLWSSTSLDQNPLAPLMPLLDEPVLQDLSRLQTSKHTPVYRTENAEKALTNSDISYTPLSSELLQRFLDNWVEKGFFAF